jgi:hypothetical protein
MDSTGGVSRPFLLVFGSGVVVWIGGLVGLPVEESHWVRQSWFFTGLSLSAAALRGCGPLFWIIQWKIYIGWCQPMEPLHWLTSTNLTFTSDDLNRFNISIRWKITNSKLNRWSSNQWMMPWCLAPKATSLGCQPRKWLPLVDTSTNLNQWSLTDFKSA